MKIKEKNNCYGFQAKPALFWALLISYPLAIHQAIINGYTLTALLIFLSAFILLITNSWPGRLLLFLAAGGAIVILSSVIDIHGQFILYLMPILINIGLALLFGKTLLFGRTPLITRYAILFRSRLDSKTAIYTRRVTQLWVLFFIILAVESFLLAMYAPIDIWSLFVNILNYLFILLLFAGEYYFRIYYLDDREHLSFPRFLHKLTQVRISELK